MLTLIAVGYANVGLSFSRAPANVFTPARVLRIGVIGNPAHVNRLLQAKFMYDLSHPVLRDGHGIALLEYEAAYNTESDGGQIPLLVAVGLEHDEMASIPFVKDASNLPVGGEVILLKRGGRITGAWAIILEIAPYAIPFLIEGIEYLYYLIFPRPNGDECAPRLLLICTTKRGDEIAVRLLLEHGADPNVQDDKGMTSLIHATKRGDEGMVRLLLEYEADPNILDDNGMSALSYAAEKGRRGIMEVLLEYGADPNYGGRHQFHSYVIEEGSAINPQLISTATTP